MRNLTEICFGRITKKFLFIKHRWQIETDMQCKISQDQLIQEVTKRCTKQNVIFHERIKVISYKRAKTLQVRSKKFVKLAQETAVINYKMLKILRKFMRIRLRKQIWGCR